MKIRPMDLVAVVGVGLGIAWVWKQPGARPGAQPQVIIQSSAGRTFWPLSRDHREAFPGPLGQTVVEIRAGKVRVLSSPCPHQTCAHAGSIGQEGGWTACLPNRVFVRVQKGVQDLRIEVKERGSEEGLDGRIW